jgi:hypothetical protein
MKFPYLPVLLCYKNCQDSSGESSNLAEIHLGDDGTDRTSNITIKNNAAYAPIGEYAVYINDALTNNTGIVIDYNIWYKNSGDWYKWGESAGSTIAGWRTASSQGTKDANADPQYSNGATGAVQLLPPRNLCVKIKTGNGADIKPGYKVKESTLKKSHRTE